MNETPNAESMPTSPMQGRRMRRPVDDYGSPKWAWPPDIRDFEPGDYMLVVDPEMNQQVWFVDPFGMVGRVIHHTITEEDDGSITVEPSIADEGIGSFHGWLRHGVWTW